MAWRHKLRAVAWWGSADKGLAKSDSALSVIHFAAPMELRGTQGQWSPEELLLAALASSLTTTFHFLAAARSLQYTDLEVETEVCEPEPKAGKESCFDEMTVRPKVMVPCQEDRGPALELLRKALALCPVSQALSVKLKFEAQVEVSQLSLVG